MIAGLGLWYSASDPAYDAFTYGQAIPTLFDSSGNGWDATQGTGSNQAIWLTHDGRNYVRGVGGTTTNTVTANVLGALEATSIRIEFLGRPTTWRPASTRGFYGCGNFSSGSRRADFRLTTTGLLNFRIFPDGTDGGAVDVDSTAAVPNDGAERGVAADWDGTTVRFYTGTGLTLASMQWTQLGSDVAFSPVVTVAGGRTRWLIAISGSSSFTGQFFEGRRYHNGVLFASFNAQAGNFNSELIPVPEDPSVSWSFTKSGLNPAMIVSARAFLPLTDDFYDISASAADVLRNVSGGTMIAARSMNSTPTFAALMQLSTPDPTLARMVLRTSTTNYSAGGRRLDADTFVSNNVAGHTAYNFVVQAARLNYSAALSANFVNGSLVGSESAFQTAGNSEDTASAAMRVFSNFASSDYQSGPVTDLCLYNRAVPNAQIRSLSRYFAGRTGGAITV
jgi:hypothetical protein